MLKRHRRGEVAVRKNPHKKMGHGFVLAESILRNRDRGWYNRLIV